MDPAVVFGRVLRTFRKEKSMTQEQLALAAGVERNFVSLIERGVNQPALRIIFKLATALETTPSMLLAVVEERLENSAAGE